MIIGVKTTYKPDSDASAGFRLRGTRVQVVIIENGKYLLIKHSARGSGRLFWGLPGGSVEPDETVEAAALREILEETGLRVRLLPYRIDRMDRFYNKTYVTFLAYPLEGEEQIGTDPEPETAHLSSQEALRWQDLNDDHGLDEMELENIRPVRDLLESTDLLKRAGIAVYRRDEDATRFLIVSRHSFPDKWFFPQVTVRAGYTPEEAAQEAADEGGLEVKLERSLGFFIQEGIGGFYRTEIFLAEYVQGGQPTRFREMRWVTYPESVDLNMDRENHRFLADLHPLMH